MHWRFSSAKLMVGWLPSGGRVMAEGALESVPLVRWSGLALLAGGVLLAVAIVRRGLASHAGAPTKRISGCDSPKTRRRLTDVSI